MRTLAETELVKVAGGVETFPMELPNPKIRRPTSIIVDDGAPL